MCNLQNFELTDFLVCAGIGASAPKMQGAVNRTLDWHQNDANITKFWVIKWASSSKEMANGVVTKSSNLFPTILILCFLYFELVRQGYCLK
jgi:hypothetical protein